MNRASVYTQELINLVLRALLSGFSRPTSKAREKRPGDEVEEPMWLHDCCDRAKLCGADLESGALHIGYFCAML